MSVFDLPHRLAHKTDQGTTAADDRHLAEVSASLQETIADLRTRIDVLRAAPGRSGQAAMDRDMEVHRLTGRLRALRRHGVDFCLGNMIVGDDPDPVYVGRVGLSDRSGRPMVLDWRSPAAEPFFAATHAVSMDVRRRRRCRWSRGRIVDFSDEVFATNVHDEAAFAGRALDDHSAFIASLGTSRTPRMRDVLATIAADQHAAIRADSRGALVVDGGPGTGKTVVALHRTAYLLYSDPRLGHRGGVLVIGPHRPYLAYVGDVLPDLGEEGVMTATLADLVPQGATAAPETSRRVAAIKASARLVSAINRAVAFYEEPPRVGILVETDHSDVWLSEGDFAAAFDAPEAGTPHNEARTQIWDELAAIVASNVGRDVSLDNIREVLRDNDALVDTVERAWPLLEATDVVGDLWTVPAYLRMCAPWLTSDDVEALHRVDAHAWTLSDLPFLDAARQRLGDPEHARHQRICGDTLAAERERRSAVVDTLVSALADEGDDGDGDSSGLVSILRGGHLRDVLVDEVTRTPEPDRLAGPFAHVVVDEAQELTDAQWQMVLSRCPSKSLTVVGDRAQARNGFTERWEQRLARAGVDRVVLTHLTVNYRTPQEVMAVAEPVIRSVLPDANVPTSIRDSGIPVRYGSVVELFDVVDTWLGENTDGIVCVVAVGAKVAVPSDPRVRVAQPELTKGLEFDLVVLVDPAGFGDMDLDIGRDGIAGAVDRYVAMTRATRELVVLSG